ncbi:hypothetical protein B0H19DRAFT_1068260 [Mycena capillaripes]|nr:hypothetical protein B0H19DRAFT_1068260 [Mycena capillaripes]
MFKGHKKSSLDTTKIQKTSKNDRAKVLLGTDMSVGINCAKETRLARQLEVLHALREVSNEIKLQNMLKIQALHMKIAVDNCWTLKIKGPFDMTAVGTAAVNGTTCGTSQKIPGSGRNTVTLGVLLCLT